jgi:hypothetical protein
MAVVRVNARSHRLLLSQLSWCDVVAGGYKLLVSFTTLSFTLDSVVMELAQGGLILSLPF